MNMNPKEYDAYVKQMGPKSPIWKDCFHAFWIGGLICVLDGVLQVVPDFEDLAGSGRPLPWPARRCSPGPPLQSSGRGPWGPSLILCK